MPSKKEEKKKIAMKILLSNPHATDKDFEDAGVKREDAFKK